jgi:hypothetical protein
MLSTFRLIYYWVDFVLGHALRILPLRRSGALVIVERGYWDVSVDPARYRLRVSPTLVRLLGRAVPKPDAVLVLRASPEVLVRRSGELPEPEVARQLRIWNGLAAREEWTILDVASPEAAIAAAAARLIESRQQGSHARRR